MDRYSLPRSSPGNRPRIFQLQSKGNADLPAESGLSSWAAAPLGASSEDMMKITQSSGEDTATNFQLVHLRPAVTTVTAHQKPSHCLSRKTSGATISFRAVQAGSYVPQHTPWWSRGGGAPGQEPYLSRAGGAVSCRPPLHAAQRHGAGALGRQVPCHATRVTVLPNSGTTHFGPKLFLCIIR